MGTFNSINLNENEALCLIPSFTTASAESALISCLETPYSGPTVTLLTSYLEAVKFLLTRYETNENIFNAQSEITSLIEGPTTDPFDFREDLLENIGRLESSYSGEDIKSLFGDVVTMSIKPKVRFS